MAFGLDWADEVPYMSSDYEKHKLLSQKEKKSVTDKFGQRILRKKMDNYYYDYFSKNKQE